MSGHGTTAITLRSETPGSEEKHPVEFLRHLAFISCNWSSRSPGAGNVM